MPAYSSVLTIADGVADALGLLRRPLQADALLALARRRSGLGDFGDTSFIDPLRRLLASCTDEASLSLVGRMATRWDVVRFLTNLLHFQDAEQRDPGILQPADRAADLHHRPAAQRHHLSAPAAAGGSGQPRPARLADDLSVSARKRRARAGCAPARVARQLRAFERLAPEFRALHPLDATSPQECSEITAHVFRSLRFDTTYRIPSYRRWLDQAGHLPAYRFHRRFLQHLQHQAPGGRWVVKCPDHLFALDAIRAVYPDARLVFVHRDPVKVLLSVAKLTEVLRRPFTRRLDPREIGRQESARWLEGTQQMMAVGDDAGLPEPIHHVQHTALVADPVGTVAALYRHFGLTLAPRVAAAIEQVCHGSGRTAAMARATIASRIMVSTPARSARSSAATWCASASSRKPTRIDARAAHGVRRPVARHPMRPATT